MNIKLTEEEWEFLKCSWQHERSHAYRSYVGDKECDIKLDLLNLYDDLLAKLGSEYVDDQYCLKCKNESIACVCLWVDDE